MKYQVHILIAVLAVLLVVGNGCTELKEGLPPPVASGPQVHLDSWTDKASSNFHGSFANANVSSCLACHGQDYNGGTSDVSCIRCHQTANVSLHGRGWMDTASTNFHGKTIRAANWDMSGCRTCHGATYAGGKVPVSCTTCHNDGAGPENCATCHGTSTTNPAPPRDLSKKTQRSDRGVGAHQAHVTRTALSALMACSSCHLVPSQAYASGHFDATPRAEVVMNIEIARVVTNKPGTPNYTPSLPLFTPNPTYSMDSLTCSSSYCHGYFKNGNTDFKPLWNTTSTTQAACGTCHGDVTKTNILERALPKTAARGGSHPTIPTGWTCANCHGDVVNASTQIINASKHINGKLNIGPIEMDY